MAVREALAVAALLTASVAMAVLPPQGGKMAALHNAIQQTPGAVTGPLYHPGQSVIPGMVPPQPCTVQAIRLAAAQHVAPDLINCVYDQVQPYLQQFFHPPSPTQQPKPDAIGMVVGQSPAANAPIDQAGLTVTVGVANPSLPKPQPQPQPDPQPKPKPHPLPPLPPQPQPPCSAPDDTDCMIYPDWVWPAAAALGIAALLGLGWLIFHKRTDRDPRREPDSGGSPPELTDPPPDLPPPPTIHCEMEPDAPRLHSAGPLAQTPHIVIGIDLAIETVRISTIVIEREEIVRDR